jgi:hypothetical protein
MVEYRNGKTPELSDSPTSSYLVANQEDVAKEMINVVSRSIFVQTSKGPLTCTVFFQHEADVFSSPSKEGVLRIFIALGRV